MRISDWSSDVCSSDLHRCRLSAPRQVISAAYPDPPPGSGRAQENTTEAFGRGLSVSDRGLSVHEDIIHPDRIGVRLFIGGDVANRFRIEDDDVGERPRSEEHTSELQSLMRISYAVFCLKKKKTKTIQ